jgi:hypothetical protein
MRCFSGAHDTNQSIDRGPRVATGKRADFDESLGHGVLWFGRGDRGWENEPTGAHESTSSIVTTIRPATAIEIR